MCEVYGFCGNTPITLNKYTNEFWKHAKIHQDGFGYYLADKDQLYVNPKSAIEFLQGLAKFDFKSKLALCHIRFKTHGNATKENCHPFSKYDCRGTKWTLVHNGYICDNGNTAALSTIQDGETDSEVYGTFSNRLCYDIAVKLPYWYRKYNYVKKLLTDTDFSLLQTSKMTSSSTDKTDSASGTLQKTATTPTGVSVGTADDDISITMTEGENITENTIATTGFADKYTNAQQKFANAGSVKGERSGEVLREGSIDELINVLEKLPSSFANEISIALQKHFIFDYDGEERGIYNETN